MAKQSSILFLDHAAVLGGAELSLRDVAVHFRDRAEVVLLEEGPLRPLLEAGGVRVQVIEASSRLRGARRESGLAAALGALPALGLLLRRLWPVARRSGVLYANSQKAFVMAACLGLLARRPVIWHLRDVLTADHFSRLNRGVATRLARIVGARVIANSEATRRSFIEAGGLARQVVTIHNGISPAAHDAVSQQQGTCLRAQLGLSESNLVVGAFSRLTPWKGQDVLVEAVARLPGVHALIVGDALFGEQAYKQQFQKRIDELGVADRVHLLGFRNDVPALMKACDIIAHTSVAPEPFGRVIVEGMLARRPVVASAAGGVGEIITADEHGLRVPPGDAGALARAIAGLQADPARRAAMATAGRARAVSVFSVEAMLGKVEREIDAVLHGRPPAAAPEQGDAEVDEPLSSAASSASSTVGSAVRAER